MENGEPFCTVGGNADWCNHCGKLKMDLSFDPSILHLVIYLKKPKTLIWKNISSLMFISALFTVTKIWKQPKCPSVDEYIKQLWDIYTVEYLLGHKKEEEFTLYDKMVGPGGDCAKWNKPVKKRQVPHQFLSTKWFMIVMESHLPYVKPLFQAINKLDFLCKEWGPGTGQTGDTGTREQGLVIVQNRVTDVTRAWVMSVERR